MGSFSSVVMGDSVLFSIFGAFFVFFGFGFLVLGFSVFLVYLFWVRFFFVVLVGLSFIGFMIGLCLFSFFDLDSFSFFSMFLNL